MILGLLPDHYAFLLISLHIRHDLIISHERVEIINLRFLKIQQK